MLFLPIPRLEIFKDTIFWKYGISLTAHEMCLKFVANSKEEAKKWFLLLKTHGDVVLVHISHDYNLGKILARKTNVTTQLGNNKKTGSEYLIKSIMKKKLANNPRSLITLVNQIKMLKLFKGQNVIQLFNVYESENYVHLVMEHTESVDILSAIKRKDNYTERDARRIIKELLKIVSAFHDKKMIHRDINPENIIIS